MKRLTAVATRMDGAKLSAFLEQLEVLGDGAEGEDVGVEADDNKSAAP